MPVKIAIAQSQVAPGQRVRLENISWQEFEETLEDLGEHRHSHIAYTSHGDNLRFLVQPP
jgi:hypothetical protein